MCNRIMDEDVPLSSFEKHLKNAKLHLIEGETVQHIDLEEVEVQALEELKEGYRKMSRNSLFNLIF